MDKFSANRIQNYGISLATLEDAQEITNLLKSTARWIKEQNIDQWSYLLNGGEDEEIKNAILNQETFIVKSGEQIIATFVLYYSKNEWDQELWNDASDDAVYLHRLAVDREFGGQGLGKEIMNWVKFYLENKDVAILRLDCVAHNQKLKEFYEASGLNKKEIKNGQAKYELVLPYEAS